MSHGRLTWLVARLSSRVASDHGGHSESTPALNEAVGGDLAKKDENRSWSETMNVESFLWNESNMKNNIDSVYYITYPSV